MSQAPAARANGNRGASKVLRALIQAAHRSDLAGGVVMTVHPPVSMSSSW